MVCNFSKNVAWNYRISIIVKINRSKEVIIFKNKISYR